MSIGLNNKRTHTLWTIAQINCLLKIDSTENRSNFCFYGPGLYLNENVSLYFEKQKLFSPQDSHPSVRRSSFVKKAKAFIEEITTDLRW